MHSSDFTLQADHFSEELPVNNQQKVPDPFFRLKLWNFCPISNSKMLENFSH
jgi:hypothetical protein